MKKKVFMNKALKRINLYECLSWLLPIPVTLIMMVRNYKETTHVFFSDYSVTTKLSALLFYLLVGTILSIIPFAIVRVFLHHRKKQAKKNSTFVAVHDLDYYREKLTGLDPGQISLISDLQIEPHKDISASILRFTEMGVLRQEGNRYVPGEFSNVELKESDRYMLNGLVNGTFNMAGDPQWRKMVIQETVNAGYITSGATNEVKKEVNRRSCGGCLIALLLPIILFSIGFGLLYHMTQTIDMEALDRFDVEIHMVDENDIGAILKVVNNNPFVYVILAEILFSGMLLMASLISPVFVIAGYAGFRSKWNLLRRTAKGNEYAEYIWGMKSFIHDYSNLSEADKEQAVLWEDYLIYAVVLEENQQIVNDIYNRRKKIK